MIFVYIRFAVFTFLVSFGSAGCATLFNSGSQTITVTSSSGDEVPVTVRTPSGSYKTKLPATVVAKPSTFNDVTVTVDDACYDPTSTVVDKQITASFWANIFNGWGFFLDPFTGAMWNYDHQVSVVVNKKAECLAH